MAEISTVSIHSTDILGSGIKIQKMPVAYVKKGWGYLYEPEYRKRKAPKTLGKNAGVIWNLSIKEDREKCLELIRSEGLIYVSPGRMPYSNPFAILKTKIQIARHFSRTVTMLVAPILSNPYDVFITSGHPHDSLTSQQIPTQLGSFNSVGSSPGIGRCLYPGGYDPRRGRLYLQGVISSF